MVRSFSLANRIVGDRRFPGYVACVCFLLSILIVWQMDFNFLCRGNPGSPTANQIWSMEKGFSEHPLDSYSFTLLPSRCAFPVEKKQEKPRVLVIVRSHAINSATREFIRTTWGNVSAYANTKLIFALGHDTLPSVIEAINQEAKTFNDVMQMNFSETNSNIKSLKFLMSVEYITKHCSDSNLVLFLDDNVVINIDFFHQYLETLDYHDDVFEGRLLDKAQVSRSRGSPYFASCGDYPYTTWCPFVSSHCFLMSFSVIQEIPKYFLGVKHLGNDDIWLGMVVKVTGIMPRNNFLFYPEMEYSERSIIRVPGNDLESLMRAWGDLRVLTL